MRFARPGRKVSGALVTATAVLTAHLVAPRPANAGPPAPVLTLDLDLNGEASPLTVATDDLSDEDMRAPVKASVERDAQPVFELYESMGNSLEGVEIDVTMAEPQAPGIVEVQITGKGPDGTSKQESLRCEYCTESDLVSRTVDAIGKLLPRLGGEVESGDGGSTPQETDTDPGPTEAPDDGDDDGKRRGLGPLGIGGAVAMGVGVATLVPGAVLAAREDVTTEKIGDNQRRSTKPAGYALVGTGAALLITGVALLVVDRKRAKQGDERRAQALLVPTGTGVVLTGRF